MTYTDLFRNVYALFSGFEKWNQFSHLFTFLLWLKGTLLFGNFLHDCFRLVKALLLAWLHRARRGPAELERHLFALAFRGVLFDGFCLQRAFHDWPFGALFASGVALRHLLAFLFLLFTAHWPIFFHFVLVVPCSTFRSVLS